ncbi:MAG TPA: hypothetical protein VL123_02580 [Candidatus Udaeobacter sp.]|jgi:hypothetical protein|nr:hypothetical protein [Candidatus Udaeobacter sp.]
MYTHSSKREGAVLALAVTLMITLAVPAVADTPATTDSTNQTMAAVPSPAPTTETIVNPIPNLAAGKNSMPSVEIQYFRPHDARGLNVFEAPKVEGAPYEGNKIQWGAAFTQQFQHLTHDNSADPKIVGGVDANKLIDIGPGFNNADANLFLDAQMARGIRVAMTSYLSSRHHQETWVKDGYLQIDASPIENRRLEQIMKYTTVRAGHFEINYGDAHFRASDNGNTIFNPFVGNLLMNAFTTEIGAEVYQRARGVMAMAGITGGEIHGQVTAPGHRTPTFLGKLGFDREISPALRVRLTGSLYRNARSPGITLYSGSRAGSRYFDVLENTQSTETAQAWSGDVQPGLNNRITAMVLNPFIKFHGLELFGNFEQAEGGTAAEFKNRVWHQNAGDVVYRFYNEQLYVGGRYCMARGVFAAFPNTVTIDRTQGALGWYVTPRILAKAEYVQQNYRDFPVTDIRNGGKFQGMMFEGAVSF